LDDDAQLDGLPAIAREVLFRLLGQVKRELDPETGRRCGAHGADTNHDVPPAGAIGDMDRHWRHRPIITEASPRIAATRRAADRLGAIADSAAAML
jgi:hypothetical protein